MAKARATAQRKSVRKPTYTARRSFTNIGGIPWRQMPDWRKRMQEGQASVDYENKGKHTLP